MATAAAVVGAAVIGGISSSQSAREASEAQRDAAGTITAAGNRARTDVSLQIPIAQQQLLAGARGAFDIFQEAIPAQQQQLSQGNIAAQQTTGRGFEQAQQALLGQSVTPFSTSSVQFDPRPFRSGETALTGLGSMLNNAPLTSDEIAALQALVFPQPPSGEFIRPGQPPPISNPNQGIATATPPPPSGGQLGNNPDFGQLG